MEHGKAVYTGEGPELGGYLRVTSWDVNAGEVLRMPMIRNQVERDLQAVAV